MQHRFNFPRPVANVGDCIVPLPIWKDGQPRRTTPKHTDLTEYSRIGTGEEKWAAHRLSYCLNVAPIPRLPNSRKEGLVLHTCDNKGCINPAHLYVGTAAKNAQDNAKRNAVWLQKRREIQKKKGFPEVSKEGRARMANANSKRMKRLWTENPEEARRQRGI